MEATAETQLEPNPRAEPETGDAAIIRGDGARVYVLDRHRRAAGNIYARGTSLAEATDTDQDAPVLWVAFWDDLRRCDRPIETHTDAAAAVEDGVVLAFPAAKPTVVPLERVDADGEGE